MSTVIKKQQNTLKKGFTRTPKFGVTLQSKGGFTRTPTLASFFDKVGTLRNIFTCRRSDLTVGSEKFKKHLSMPKLVCGFTLIETLVAVAILLITIIGPMEIASKGLLSAFYARDEITAYYLAQEGLEYVRNGRDTTSILDSRQGEAPHDWLDGFDECDSLSNPGVCAIDATKTFYDPGEDGTLNEDAVTVCPGGRCDPLRYDEGTGVYSYNQGDAVSKFTRSIVITHEPGDKEVLVESTVSWRTGGSDQTFTLRERLFNWRQ